MGKERRVNKRLSLVALLVLCFAVETSSAFASRRERLIDSWKPTNYSVALTLNRDLTAIVRATTEVTVAILKPKVSRIDLDFGGMPIDSVSVNSRRARFSRERNLLLIRLPSAFKTGSRIVVSISYHGKPEDGLVMSRDKDGHPSAVGDNWPNRVHHWIPSFDHPSAKAPVSFSITLPSEYAVVANGRLARVQSSVMTRTWTYKEQKPIPPYCMIFAAGQFAKVKSAELALTNLYYYVPRSDETFAVKGFSAAAPALRFFSETVAPYPYEKLALIVGATQFGGMENSSAIVFSSNIFSSKSDEEISPTFGVRRGIVELVAHEIAHQWFGDSVTESTWADLWLSEGFATYFAGLFIQKAEGEVAFRAYMKKAAAVALSFEQQQRIPIHDNETEDLFKLLNANNYQKGAWVLHMLRSQLGDEIFFRGIREFYGAHQGATASSEDLRVALEHASGLQLDTFFKSWIYGTGHPVYELSWDWFEQRQLLQITLQQKQNETAFPNWLPVTITTAAGEQKLVLKPNSKEFIEEFPLSSAPRSIQVDPENTVLMEVHVEAPDVFHR
jgi:aminopeptidase N